MKTVILILATLFMTACNQKTELVEIYTPANGINGTNGTGCYITYVSNGALIVCGDTSMVVLDGQDAPASALGVASYIKPCGDNFDNDEIFLRMSDGKILALYDGGNLLSRLVLLAPGSYRTTDINSNYCTFTVDENYVITYTGAL